MAKKERDLKGKQYRPKAAVDDGPPPKPKPKSRRARRAIEAKEPKLVEDPKKALLLYGNRTSQTIKDVLSDIGKLKALDAVKLTRKNADVRPFETGGEAQLEYLGRRADAGLFAVGTTSKKRPDNLTLGRFYDGRIFDVLEVGVSAYRSLRDFGAAAAQVQTGNKPAIVFAGDGFEQEPALEQAKSLLLDFFRGRQVTTLSLKGLDRVMCVSCADSKTLLVRQYHIRLKKTGTKLPRVELEEMGPRFDLTLRRNRPPPPDLAKEALRVPKTTATKVKNVSGNDLDGKVGRVYMPPQDIGEVALHKMKGLKRQQRDASAEAKLKKLKKSRSESGSGSDGGDGDDGAQSEDVDEVDQ